MAALAKGPRALLRRIPERGARLALYFGIALIGALVASSQYDFLTSALIFGGLYLPLALSAILRSQATPADPQRVRQDESDLRFRTLIQNAPEAMVVYDAKTGKFVDANRNAQRLFDYALPDLLKLGPVDVSPHSQPSGVSSKHLAEEKIAEALRGKTPVFEWTHQNRSGQPIPCEVQLVRLPSNGKNLIRGSILDISSRKQYENEHQKHMVAENQRTEELAGLALAGASISSSLELDKVLQVVARQLTNLLDMQICIISDWGKNGSGPQPRLEFISRIHKAPPRGFEPTSLLSQIDTQSLVQQARPIQKHLGNSTLPEKECKVLEAGKVNTLLLLPLVSQGKSVGVIELQDTRAPRRINEHELYLAQTLCQQAASAIENARLFQSTRRQLEELTILKEVAIACTEATDEDELIARCTELIRNGLYPDNFGILLLSHDGQQLHIHPSYESDESIKEKRINLGEGVTGRVAASGQALRVQDTSTENNYLGFDSITRSELCVPMKIGGRVIGVINAESHELDHFAQADENLLQTFAGQLASGIERLRRENAEYRKAAQLRVLNGLTGELSGILERKKLYELVAKRLYDHMDYYNACVFSIDEENDQAVLEAAHGIFKELVAAEGYRQALDKGLLGLAARSGQVVLINDVKQDPNYYEPAGMEATGSELVVPIKIYKKVVALLNVDYDRSHAFSEEEVASLQTLAEQISIALESISLFEATRRQLQELTVLHAIANAAVSAKSEDELLERATEVIGATLYPDTFGFLMLDESREHLRPHRSYRGIDEARKNSVLTLKDGVSGRVASTAKPWRIPDVRKEPNYREVNPGMRSELCVPLVGGDGVLGVVNAESADIDAFTDADMRLLSTIAGQLGTALDKLRLIESERLQRKQAETLREASAILAAASDIETVSDLILEQLRRVVPFDSASIQIVKGEYLRMQAVAGNLDKEILGYNLSIAEDKLAHPIIYEQRTVLYEDISEHPDWLQIPGSNPVKSWIGAPLIVRGDCVGVLTVDGYESNQFTEVDAQLVSSFAIHAGIAIENARLFQELEEAYTQTVSALANAIDVRDTYTSGHSQRLARLAVETGRLLNCSERELEDIHWAALLHDIGKIGVPDQILSKPAALDSREMDVIRQHPEIGARIVEPVKNLSRIAPIIRAHQEHFDGSGYPHHLKGSEIPKVARIISVADAYVAMTDERVYRRALSHEDAISELKRCSGSQFDPKVVDAFLVALEKEEEIY